MTDQTKEAWTPGPWDKERIGYVHKDGVLHPPEPDQTRLPGESWLDMRHRIEPELAAREAECRANINLRRAAPELYAALKHARQNMPHPDQMIDDALAKARGEQC